MLGKADWLARNLPVEGDRADTPTAGRVAREDVVTCSLTDQVGELRQRIDRSPYRFALVVSPEAVVLGRLPRSALDGDPAARAEDVMEPGPSTVRADLDAAALAKRDLHTAIVTNPDGVLIGVVRREDLAGDG